MKNVQVLMSAYNGEKYIKEQIDTILNQKDVNINLLVRDDGSKDNTIKILEEYSQKKVLKYYTGQNIGVAQSFLNLVKNSDDVDYYCFSDQDDIWLPDKVISAILLMEENNNDADMQLYYSEAMMVDENKREIGITKCKTIDTFDHSLIVDRALGCTIVFNKKLRDILNQYSPQKIFTHDWWIYKLYLALNGEVIYDKNYHIYYRQHSGNTIGMGGCKNIYKKWKRRFENAFINKSHIRESDVIELINGYGNMLSKDKLETLQIIKNYRMNFRCKLKLLFLKIDGLTIEQRILKFLAILLNKF